MSLCVIIDSEKFKQRIMSLLMPSLTAVTAVALGNANVCNAEVNRWLRIPKWAIGWWYQPLKRPWTLRRMRCMSHRAVQSNHNCYILINSGNYPQPLRAVITFELCDALKSNFALSVGSHWFMFRRFWNRTLRPAIMNAVSTVFFSPPFLTLIW